MRGDGVEALLAGLAGRNDALALPWPPRPQTVKLGTWTMDDGERVAEPLEIGETHHADPQACRRDWLRHLATRFSPMSA